MESKPRHADILHFTCVGSRRASVAMNRSLQKLGAVLGSAYPTAGSPYWRALPLRRMKSLLAGVFFTTAVAGFAANLVQLNAPPVGRGFFWPALVGAGAVSVLVAQIKSRSFFLIFIVVLAMYTCIWIAGGGG